jgi:dolichyl-diphosphooligosaccharide--protein glycosyltransferase
MFIDKPDGGIRIARQLKTNYILIYIVAQRFAGTNGTSFYTLGSGGDESKKHWFIRIAGFNESNYLEKDDITRTQIFWNRTLLGQLIPFTIVAYGLRDNSSRDVSIQQEYSPGSIAIYSKHIKYPNNAASNQPLSLVYSSDSFNSNTPREAPMVFIYKVNYDKQISQR